MIFLLLALWAASGDADFAGWVRAQGGSVTRDRAGNVTGVGLRASWVTDGDMGRLTKIATLKTLDLSYTHVTDLGLERLKPAKGIRELNLRYAEHVTDEGLAHLKGWQNLELLDVR